MAVTNKQIIETVVEDLPLEHKERLTKDGKALSSQDMLRAFEQYPTAKNAFLETLTNKIAKTMIYSKTWENPWAMLKREKMEYGDTIEDLFVHIAQMKNFGEHWEDNETPEADLIRKIKPVVVAMYKTQKIDKKFKTTVFDKDMRKAFETGTGLSKIIQQIVSSISTAINYHEFNFMKSTLCRAIDGIEYDGSLFVNKHIKETAQKDVTLKKVKAIEVRDYDANPQNLVRLIRENTGLMKYMSKDYNCADQITFSKPEDLVFVTTPGVSANLDVNVLAHAFNVSSTDIKTRIVEIDKFDVRTQTGEYKQATDDGITQETVSLSDCSAIPTGKQVLGVLMDKSFLDIRDKYIGSGTFYNPEGQYTNHFANREYFMSICLFANAIVFYK